MTTEPKKLRKFYPSSSAFMIGDTVITKYDSGCLRSILIKSHKIRTGDIPKAYKRVGARHEDIYYAMLQADAKNVSIQKEFVVKRLLSPEVEYSGRLDFKVFREGLEDAIVHETKGTISKSTRRDVIRKGEFNISYLAQTVSYMVELRTQKAKLAHAYYEEDEAGELQQQEYREFKVTITDTGRIDVDGEPSGFNVADLLEHQLAAVHVLETDTIAARPDKWNQKYGGPCSLCAFARTCTLQDQGAFTSTEQFLDSARQDAENSKTIGREEPVPFKIKIPKPVKEGKKRNGKSKKVS